MPATVPGTVLTTLLNNNKIIIDYPKTLKEKPRISISGWNLKEKIVEISK